MSVKRHLWEAARMRAGTGPQSNLTLGRIPRRLEKETTNG